MEKDFTLKLDIELPPNGKYGFMEVEERNTLTIKKGYAWDGPSGPTIDTKSFMRGALVHDALYQLMREGSIDQDQRVKADQILKQLCLEDGMWAIRAFWVYWAVRKFAAFAAQNKVYIAP